MRCMRVTAKAVSTFHGILSDLTQLQTSFGHYVSSYELSDNEEGADSLSTPSSSSQVGSTRVSSSESDSDNETCDEATNRGEEDDVSELSSIHGDGSDSEIASTSGISVRAVPERRETSSEGSEESEDEGGSGVPGNGVSGLGPSSWVETGQKRSKFKAKFQAGVQENYENLHSQIVFLNFFYR
ncbi:hypothetical protein C0J52_15752 [Blattella germanica]|nr:hypothetical protein C0J52_15752 [Blattella germanica]